MNKKITSLLIVLIAIAFSGTTLAVNPHPGGTGQPGASCEEECGTPGHSAAAQGSAFNPEGIAGQNYAGNNPNAPGFTEGHANDNAVSQYDVGCLEVSDNPSSEHNPGCTTC